MHQDDASNNQNIKPQEIVYDSLPKIGKAFLNSLGAREQGFKQFNNAYTTVGLETYAEDELVRKEYKEMQCEIPRTPRSTFLMVFSPDGTKAASTHGNHNIYVTDLRTGKNIQTLSGHPRTPWCIAFHPTSNQIIASGCLGGQVRIWDLSGGSEVWTTETQTVIASLAFHPNERLLVIATYNELYFWDWSQPNPFLHTCTNNVREKVRYVAFDRLGHKLITGIANTPQTRWERVRAPVPVPRQAERSASPYRRRITPRLVTNIAPAAHMPPSQRSASLVRESLVGIPERERRITVCYRNLVEQYELLVNRYLEIYRPATTIDRGTDPMEPYDQNRNNSSSNSNNPGPSTSGVNNLSSNSNNNDSTSIARNSNSQTQNLQCNRNTSENQQQASDINAPSGSGGRNITHTHEEQQIDSSSTSDEEGSNFYIERKRVKIVHQIEKNSTNDANTSASYANNDETRKKSSQRNDDNASNPGPSTSKSNDSINNSNSSINDENDNDNDVVVNVPSGISNNRANGYTQTNRTCEVCSGSETSMQTTNNNVDASATLEYGSVPAEAGEAKGREGVFRAAKRPAEDYESTAGPSGLSSNRQFRSARSLFLPFNRRVQKHVKFHLSSDSSSSDDEESSGFCVAKRQAKDNQQEGATQRGENVTAGNASPKLSGNSTLNITRTNTSDTGTTQSSHQISAPQSQRSPRINNNKESFLNAPLHPLRRSCIIRGPRPIDGAIGINSGLSPRSATGNNQRRNTTDSAQQSQSTSAQGPSSRYSPLNIPSPLSRLRGISEGMLSSADELINFAERSNTRAEAETFESETPTVDESPGPSTNVGNIYSNILSDLEYSLDNVRNIRVNERNNETTGVLSSFSQGLESIMNQSDSILRNLRQSLDMLLERDLEIRNSREGRTTDDRSTGILGSNIGQRPRFYLTPMQHARIARMSRLGDQNFYVRSNRHPEFHSNDDNLLYNPVGRQPSTPDPEYGSADADVSPTLPTDFTPDQLPNLPSSSRNPIADHTYPRNPESPAALATSPDYIAPLVTSLHITISHISRQARLLRRQVESIERIDRAMVEVSQLQLIRQMWGDIRTILTNLSEGARRVSSMRQMMAGTRISDSNASSESSDPGPPSDQANSNSAPESSNPSGSNSNNNIPSADASPSSAAAPPPAAVPSSSSGPSASSSASTHQPQPHRHGSNRKTYPPSRLCRLQRQSRKYTLIPRRRRAFMRFERGRGPPLVLRVLPRSVGSSRSQISLETLTNIIQRLENLLAEQTRNIGSQETSIPDADANRRVRFYCERTTVDRLSAARARIFRMLHMNHGTGMNGNIAENITVPTVEGVSRMGARLTLSAIIDTMSTFLEEHGSTLTPTIRTHIKNIIVLAVLLTDIMLLQIVDSIPPPTGISLDPDREDLSARIDQMCSRMLANRLSSHSQQLTRSLRLMRLTARYASRALGITYQARRNALLPSANNNDRRFELLNQINTCLRNMHRRRGVPFTPLTFPPQPSTSSGNTNTSSNPDLPTAEWCQSVRELLTSFLNLRNIQNSNEAPAARENPENGEQTTGDGSANDAAAAPAPPERPQTPPIRAQQQQQQQHSSSLNDDQEIPLLGFSADTNPVPARNQPATRNSPELDSPLSSSGSSPRTRTLYRPATVHRLVNSESHSGSSSSGGSSSNNNNNNSAPTSGGAAQMSSRWSLPTVQVNDMPVSDSNAWYSPLVQERTIQDHNYRIIQAAANGLFRPRFLHPLYAGVNPFDADLDDPPREQPMGYDADIITTVTPNHRIQVWDISNNNIPNISNPEKNIVVAECKIHNDASVDIAKDGTLLVTLLPSGGYLNVTNRLGVYSLRWETLGQCLFTTNFEQNAVSVSLSPLSRHLIVGLASRRFSLSTDRWTIARIFFLDRKQMPIGNRLPVLREIDQVRDTNYMSVNCIRWMPVSGQGLVYATNTGQLKVLS